MIPDILKPGRESAEYAEILADLVFEILNKKSEDVLAEGNVPHELTRSLIECLQFIYLHGDSSLKRVSYGLSISTPAASQLVERLVRKELVERREAEGDRRSVLVQITRSGVETIKSICEARTLWFSQVLSRMSDSARVALTTGLEGFIQAAAGDSDELDRSCAKCGMKHVNFCILNKIRSSRALEADRQGADNG